MRKVVCERSKRITLYHMSILGFTSAFGGFSSLGACWGFITGVFVSGCCDATASYTRAWDWFI
jgi:hypothetical protein